MNSATLALEADARNRFSQTRYEVPMNTPTTPTTRGQKTNADISALLRARNTLLWVVTREELRVERALVEIAGAATYEPRCWDCATGITKANGDVIDADKADPTSALDYIGEQGARQVYIMRDLHKWIVDPMVQRRVCNLARSLQTVPKDIGRCIIVLTPSTDVPPEIARHAVVIDYPIPDRAEMGAILDASLDGGPKEAKAIKADVRDGAIDAAVGLTAEEAASCFARSMVTSRKIDPVMVANEKKRVIAREKVLTWHDPDPRGLAAVGGLDLLKAWLTKRRAALTPAARAYGLPAPKGAFLVGVPGCGKSLTAKAIATAFSVPLLRLDMGALRSKFVGDSEANIRKALATAETVSPCVLWIDEIEKALGGATGPQGDGGVAADALGAVLSWMQERTGTVFVVATANDVSALPPELLRKGRFDEVFFVDLPTTAERAQIMAAALRQHSRDPEIVDVQAIARATVDFTGSELAELVPDAMFTAFDDGQRAIATADLLAAAESVVPLAKTAAEKIEALRTWVKGRARPASTPETKTTGAAGGRVLDIED